MTTRNPVRQTEGDFTPLGYSTGSEDYLLWGTNPDDVLLFSIFEETVWELNDTENLVYGTLETDAGLILQDSTGENIIWDIGTIEDNTTRAPFTY